VSKILKLVTKKGYKSIGNTVYNEDDYLWKRSRKNLVKTYQEELCKINDYKCEDIISLKGGG